MQLNHINGSDVTPSNFAEAFSSCDACDSFAVALQIDLISNDAQYNVEAPQNQALAVNYKCNGCDTVARALRFVIPVDDPNQVPDRVRDLVNEMNQQLDSVARDQSVSDVHQAESVLNGVITDFNDLTQNLIDQRDESTATETPGQAPPDQTQPGRTPRAAPTDITPQPAAQSSPTPQPTPQTTLQPSPTPSPTPQPSPQPTPSSESGWREPSIPLSQ